MRRVKHDVFLSRPTDAVQIKLVGEVARRPARAICAGVGVRAGLTAIDPRQLGLFGAADVLRVRAAWVECASGRASRGVGGLIVGKVIRKRNRETAMKGKISRKCSTERGSEAHNGGDGRHLSGQTRR